MMLKEDTFRKTLGHLIRGDASKAEYDSYLHAQQWLISDFVKRIGKTEAEIQKLSLLSENVLNGIIPNDFSYLSKTERRRRGLVFSILLAWSNPNYFLPLGFDQIRFHLNRINDPDLSESAQGLTDETILDLTANELFKSAENDLNVIYDLLIHTPQFRTPNGVWHDIEYVMDILLPTQEKDWEESRRSYDEWHELYLQEWIANLEKNTMPNSATSFMPALSVPLRSYPDIQVQLTIQRILYELASSKKQLAEIHWRTLEELIAELLYNDGFDVKITNRSHDGGRDVIARGEFLPGEPTILAVEVKHMAVVPISELRSALWANRNFPALLFATSGKFSSGIYRERLIIQMLCAFILRMELHYSNGLILMPLNINFDFVSYLEFPGPTWHFT